MCGRFVSPEQDDVEQLWHVRGTPDLFQRSYNVAPTMPVPIVYFDRHEGGPKLAVARWGLVPFWARGPKPPTHTFNTRLEDASVKPMWRKPFRSARCIVPATGWYEWQERDRVDPATGEIRKYKQPFFMHLPDHRPIGLAGLMSWSKAEGSGEWTSSCSILTMAAAGVAATVHNRMPVALAESAHEAWMDPALDDPDQVAAIVAEHNLADAIVMHPVSTRVNASRADDPLLLDPVNPE